MCVCVQEAKRNGHRSEMKKKKKKKKQCSSSRVKSESDGVCYARRGKREKEEKERRC